MYLYTVIKICASKITGITSRPSHMIIPNHPNGVWNIIKGLQSSFLITSTPFPPCRCSSLQAEHSPQHLTCTEVQLQSNNIPIYTVWGHFKVHIMSFKGDLSQKPERKIGPHSWFSSELLKSLFHTVKELVFRLDTIMVWLLHWPHKYWWHPVDRIQEERSLTSQPLWLQRKHHRIQYLLHNDTPVEEFGHFQCSF